MVEPIILEVWKLVKGDFLSHNVSLTRFSCLGRRKIAFSYYKKIQCLKTCLLEPIEIVCLALF